MCGIVGYVGRQQARDVVIEGLRRLEYRGYDSAGIAVVDGGHVVSAKRAGKLANLEKALEEQPLPRVDHRHRAHPLGHPRRAQRHQRASAPRRQNGRLAVVHNGIIENFAQLRAELERGRGTTSSPRPTPRSRRTCWRRPSTRPVT